MLELRNVTKMYPSGPVALKEVSITVTEGEFVFVVGPSGAGKTTLTKLLMCEERPTSGSIIINNFDVNKLRPKEVPLLRRSMGVVFQDFRLMPTWTVEENVAFAMVVVEVAPRHIRRRVAEVLSLVGLTNKRNQLPGQLSGGEQQRVALARAIVNQPSLVLADEPTGNLDPETSWGIVKLLLDINATGTTMLMVTHANQIVDSLRKRVIALDAGRVARDEEGGVYHG
ncbi:MAG: cell division transport system ATP-binding protein [Bacillota bacterium]|nr:MAG: cell division transport system ATP-binding protein [Bacillota bacterium]MBS3950563.1 cell division ATP-binding protein FtsE [Peptococcaceae bacterium]